MHGLAFLDRCSFGHFRRHQDQGNLNRMTWDEEFGHSMCQGGLDSESVSLLIGSLQNQDDVQR